MKKLYLILLIAGICLGLSLLVSALILNAHNDMNFVNFCNWTLFNFIVFALFACVTMSHKFATGKTQEVIFFFSTSILISGIIAFIIFALLQSGGDFAKLNWYGFLASVVGFNILYVGMTLALLVGFVAFYVTVIDNRILNFMGTGGLRGSGKLRQIQSNLENSRWMNEKERDQYFKHYKMSELKSVKKDGIPVMAELSKNEKDMDIVFNSPCHSIVIGSTGSGKTTTFVSPMIQLLASTSAGSSMVITDPKGELVSLHSKHLKERGYDVKVIDLRDTYSSYRWNPLEPIWDLYQEFRLAYSAGSACQGDVSKSGLVIKGNLASFGEQWFEFKGCAYPTKQALVEAIKIFKKKTFDEVYEDLNDLVSVLIPIENDQDPMWEKGARSIVLAVLIAMLEDSNDERLDMTKEKYNFFNMSKILQNSTDDYLGLRNYFVGRNPLSKAFSLSKQVCDAAEQTRASYMSIVYEKISIFNDAGICALTSSSDFSSAGLAERPTALFLKIPDEKDTRHNLAAIFILNIYKTLIKVASATEELTLPRNVYFIMDEFGNMPKIEKFDKFITVGRSRKIWFTMIIQSYAQLDNVYGKTVADILKGNCGIKMFIGSNDMETCKEYSELCGNITVVTTSTSNSVSSNDINISAQTQVRPLIYPAELQRLNRPGDLGHSIIVTFGNYPLKTYFTPSFKVKFYNVGKMEDENQDRIFDENEIYYDIAKRNELVLKFSDNNKKELKLGSASSDSSISNATNLSQVDKQNQDDGVQNAENQLQNTYAKFKQENPNATIEEFYVYMANKMKKEEE